MADLILASASPRRLELLKQIGVRVQPYPVDLDESLLDAEQAKDFVLRLAQEKARAGFKRAGGELPALGSDTAVVVDGQILGKPQNQCDAKQMLQLLSGRSHHVMTGVAIVDDHKCHSCVVVTEVCFNDINDDAIANYWASGEPKDKAGGYGIQGLGAVFVSHISGSYSAVVGLPLMETAKLLSKFDIPIWQTELSA